MAKIEIDNKKMWESLRKAMWYFPEAEWLTRSIDTALSEQGLTVNDKGEITTIEPKPKYYKCIKEYKGFTLGKIYKTNDNGDLPSDPECPFVIWIENPYFEEFFRPATDEEISQENIPTFKEVERNGKDEKIRKHIIEILNRLSPCNFDGNERGECIAWLKKQGKQISVEPMPLYDCANNILYPIVPRFKAGDTIWKKTDHSNKITISSVDKYFYYACSYNVLIDIADKEWELVEQKSTEWSEADENLIRRCIGAIRVSICRSESKAELCGFLKSLKDRCSKQWKPSEEQIYALSTVLTCMDEEIKKHTSPAPLKKLLEQLKTL